MCCFGGFRLDVLEKKLDFHISMMQRYVNYRQAKTNSSGTKNSGGPTYLQLFQKQIAGNFAQQQIKKTANDDDVTEFE